jgi:hypothetical protein
MNDYLNSIVARSLNIADVVQPRVPQLFEQPLASVPEQPDPSLQTEMRPNPPALSSETSDTSIIGTDQAASEVRLSGFEPVKPAPAAMDTYVKGIRRESPFAVQSIQPKESLAPATASQAGGALDSRSMREPATPSAAGSNQNASPQSDRELSLSTVGPPWKEGSVKTSEPSITSSPARLQPSVPNVTLSSMPQNNRSEQQQPAIRITIGRVDVRAIMPAVPPPAAAPVRPKPALSLESYLKQREEGKR